MEGLVVVGAQWGDEGKGKFVDYFTDLFDVVARYQGGHNAGHTVLVGRSKYVLHLVPSGILRPDKLCVIGNGVVVDPVALAAELEVLRSCGVAYEGRLFVSDRAHLILPVHRAIERVDETARGVSAIGTTLRGIGPAFSDKYFRHGLRVGAVRDADGLRRQCRDLLQLKRELLGEALLRSIPGEEWERFFAAAEGLRPFVTDTALLLDRCLSLGKKLLLEGAQGTMLDVEHGTYPFVTSSHATSGGAAVGTGLPPHRLGTVVGIMKAYTTRVGGGPFPTELPGETGQLLRQRGGEFGASTGRPRRCGWLDLAQMRYSCRINGFHSLLLTKLDVLDALPEISVCTEYRLDGQRLESCPESVEDLARVEPVYEAMPGWLSRTAGLTEYGQLPAAARNYIEYIEKFLGVEISMISTGPERAETIVNPRALALR